jgi:hypothetical protein
VAGPSPDRRPAHGVPVELAEHPEEPFSRLLVVPVVGAPGPAQLAARARQLDELERLGADVDTDVAFGHEPPSRTYVDACLPANQ